MLQQVVLQTTPPTTLKLDGVSPDDLIIVTSISGLDPRGLVTLFAGEFSRDGGYYQGRRRSKRNPVFNLKLNPDYKNDVEVSDIREMVYSWFLEPSPTSDGLQVVLKDDRRPDRYFVGYTEDLPAELFTKETTAQVSMLCVDPLIKSVSWGTGSDPLGFTVRDLLYEGSAKNGLEMTLLVKTATNQVVVDLDGVTMTLERPFAVNDVITINTVIGSRFIRQNGSDIMASLSPISTWLELRKGNVNRLKVYGSVENDGLVAMTDYAYQEAWWGI